MRAERRDDNAIMKALAAANNGKQYEAYRLYQKAGNQVRDPEQKDELWKAAERCRRKHYSD